MSQAEQITEDEVRGEASPSPARRAGDGVAQAPVTFDRYEIFPGKPLSAYDTSAAKAYLAVDTKGARESLMALVAAGRLPPRTDILPSLRSLDCPALLRAYRWAPIDWPDGKQRFAILYSQPGGACVMPSLSEAITPMSEDALIECVIRPAALGIGALSALGIAHRAIRPDNIYFKAGAGGQITLGDGAIAPAGSTNPVLFETIENGMTHPLGRGPGTTGDDLYALGVTILILALGFNPVAGIGARELVAAKIGKGSYAAIAGNHRLGNALREPMRGLLADDPKERWSLQDLSLWLDGRRLSPLQPTVPPHAGRGYPLAGAEYFSCRSLAHATAYEWAAVGAAVQGTDLSAWVGRAVGDTNMANTVAAAIAWGGGEASRMGDGSLAGRLCTALDPKGPLRFRGVATVIEGLGPMLSGMIRDPEGQRTFAQLVVSDLPLYWISNRYGDGVESRTLVQTVDRLRFLLKRPQLGSGIERCLYELNPSQACLSPALESHYVADADALLPALEAVAGGAGRPSFPIDRHIAAFIAARFREASESHLEAIGNRSEPAKAVLGALRTLAVLQWKLGPPQLPRLTAWLGKLAEALVDSYHANALRKQLQEHLQRVVKKGSLVELLNFVDDTSQRDRDERGYREALTAFAAADAEIDRLSAEGIVLERRAEKLASQIAAVVSTAVAVGTIAVLIVIGHG